jgi:hypothetical protein
MAINEYIYARLTSFLDDLNGKVTNQQTPTKSIMNAILDFCLEYLEMPSPPKALRRHFLFPPFVHFLLTEIIRQLPREKSTDYESLLNKFNFRRVGPFIQFRELQVFGIYPNMEISRGNCYYIIRQGYPYLVTYNAGPASFPDSEVAWITKNELRFALSIACASQSKIHHFNFGYPKGFQVPYSYYVTIPKNQQHEFLIEWARFQNASRPIGHIYGRSTKSDFTLFDYSRFSDAIQAFNKIFDSIHLSDDLLLRTASFFVKANMLWMNPVFGEEATANALFAIEGCLLLLQRKHGKQAKQIDLKFLKTLFIDKFPYGEDSFEATREAYNKRIELVHAAPKWGANWSPYLEVDDFYAYRDAVKYFLNYVLIDRLIDQP